jgi:lysophospholipase L1-like esterase
VPLYVYTQPHSTDALSNPLLIPRLAAAEEAIAAFDPGRPDVRFRSRIFTRDLQSLREGVEFIDMVHPTAAGAELLADWLAADISDFWSSIDFGR